MARLHLLLEERVVMTDELRSAATVNNQTPEGTSALPLHHANRRRLWRTHLVVPGARLKLSMFKPKRVHLLSSEGS